MSQNCDHEINKINYTKELTEIFKPYWKNHKDLTMELFPMNFDNKRFN